jgi:predicted Abi (CAAX) family protease
MKFSNWLRDLEKRKIITTKPNPIIPFILGFVYIILSIYIKHIIMYLLTGFVFIFAIIHWIVVIICKKK